VDQGAAEVNDMVSTGGLAVRKLGTLPALVPPVPAERVTGFLLAPPPPTSSLPAAEIHLFPPLTKCQTQRDALAPSRGALDKMSKLAKAATSTDAASKKWPRAKWNIIGLSPQSPPSTFGKYF
jgi:hypothetical protein